jgi:hypothetical protein
MRGALKDMPFRSLSGCAGRATIFQVRRPWLAGFEPITPATRPPPMSTTTRHIAIHGRHGIGKSTTTSNRDAAPAEDGRRLVQISRDPKSDSTHSLPGGPGAPSPRGLVRLRSRIGGPQQPRGLRPDTILQHAPARLFKLVAHPSVRPAQGGRRVNILHRHDTATPDCKPMHTAAQHSPAGQRVAACPGRRLGLGAARQPRAGRP